MSNEEAFRMMELALNGYKCSQILVQMALEAQQTSNRELVRAMTGLLSGYACGKLCGALSGGCCVLGMYAGKGTADENADAALAPMLRQYAEWFETEYTPKFGGIDCHDIVQDDARLQLQRCPTLVMECWTKLKELLAENGYDVSKSSYLSE